jgi:glycosyltransferase involved in cell wall biosynthesis
MAAGLPIVSTDAGGTKELVGVAQSQFISSRDEPEKYSLNLIRLIENKSLQREISLENLESVKKFSTEKIVEMYKKVLFE